MSNIKHASELLQQIAAGLNALVNRPFGQQSPRIRVVEVLLKTETDEYVFDLPTVLDVLANDLYWDERGNWSDARIAVVRTT